MGRKMTDIWQWTTGNIMGKKSKCIRDDLEKKKIQMYPGMHLKKMDTRKKFKYIPFSWAFATQEKECFTSMPKRKQNPESLQVVELEENSSVHCKQNFYL